MLSKSARPLSKIEIIVNVFCLGKLPIIVSTPDGDIKVISSPISKSKVKLNSLPIEIKFPVNEFLLPSKPSLLIISNKEKSFVP